MANFVVVVDPDPTRRAEYVRRAVESLGVLPTLREGRCAAGACAAAWAAPEHAPVSMLTDAEDAAVVWGRPLTSTGAHADAKHVRDAWRQDGTSLSAEAFDGFYAAVHYSRDTLIAGADLFGLFPVYYWVAEDVLLVASSIRAFRLHPLFRAAFNPVGAAGLLLTGGLLDGETLWRDVRRLSPGHVLSWSRESGAREVLQFRVPTDESLADRPFEQHVELIDEVLDATVARHVAVDGETSLLLSGGRDSRVVAGLLHRRGLAAHAVTFGEPRDYDVECAAAVAKALGFTHTIAPDPVDGLEELVRHHIRVEQLANGLANFYTWGMGPSLDSRPWVVSAYRVEDFIGGAARGVPGAPSDGSASDRVVRKATSYGVGLDPLRRLARREVFGTAVDDCLERLRARFAAVVGDDDRRSWKIDMDHRGRFHSGSTPWRLSLSAWPLLPALDRALVEFCASLPASTLLRRRAEDELLRAKFPALARLPLDRNSHDIAPLLPSAAWRIRRSVVRRLSTHAGERRRYYRLYDINSPMWRTVRHMAEPSRGRAADVLDTRELASLLPAPDATIELRDTITDSNGLKALLGFLIWWSENG